MFMWRLCIKVRHDNFVQGAYSLVGRDAITLIEEQNMRRALKEIKVNTGIKKQGLSIGGNGAKGRRQLLKELYQMQLQR